MENNNTSRRIHPLVAGAAISVMLVSLTGVAAITGLIPNSHSNPSDMPTPLASSVGAAAVATSPAALLDTNDGIKEAPASANQVAVAPKADYAPHSTKTARTTYTQGRSDYAESSVAQAPLCSSCGHIESVRAVQHAAKPSGVGIAAGAILGGVLGNQVGNGNGRTLATVAGAVGGGYAGNEVEKRSRTTTSYQVRVRMENGQIRTFPYAQQPAWNVGDRVKVINGSLTARA